MNLSEVAGNLGLPCFPCNGIKKPITPNGLYDAVLGEGARALFTKPGAAMIGVPTGAASGLIGIDVDIKPNARGIPARGREWLDANKHRLPSTRTHKTESGGLHLIFLAPLSHDIRNSASRIHDGIDVRGTGGYLIFPPSPGYVVADATPPAEMPDWLIEACLKPDPVAPQQTYTAPSQPPSDRYAAAAFDGECRAVAEAREGTRNHQLNVSAVKLGSLVAAGLLDKAAVEAGLTQAALAAGLDPVETRKTIASGLGFGMQQPRQVPERPSQPLRMMQERVVAAETYDEAPHTAAGAGQPHSKAPGPNYDPETGEVLGGDPPRKAPDLLWFDDIKPVLDTKDFVQGVLVEESAAVVYGESNAGKTFWTTDLALHVAAGKPWNGRRVEQGGVIYCVLEGGVGFVNRVSAWRDAHSPTSPVYFAARQSSLNMLDPDADTPKLIETIRDAARQIQAPIKLVVIDTLARAFAGGNENASEDMGALVLNMDAIRRATGACVLFVHHSGKDQAKGARGHSSLRAALDTEIEVKANEETGLKTATSVKQREMKKGETFHFTLGVVELGKNRHGEPVTTCLVQPASGELVAEAEAQAQAKSERLSDGTYLALKTLKDAIAKVGGPSHGTPNVPANMPSCSVEQWRSEFRSQTAALSEDAQRVAFGRALKNLIKLQKIGTFDKTVWLVRGGE